jgi:hypothetical protein
MCTVFQNNGFKLLTASLFTCLLFSSCTSGADDKPIAVTFDGESCQYSGPEVIEEGQVVIEWKNLTDNPNVYIYPVRLLDGKTWEDILDYYGEAGVFKFKPEWAVFVAARSVPDNPNALAFKFPPGQYGIICAHVIPEGEQTFPSAPFEVKPASSD